MGPDRECTRCGRCCLNMRPYIVIGSRAPDGRMMCRCTLTKEQFRVSPSDIQSGMTTNPAFLVKNPKACPFLTQDDQEIYSCIIYPSRPGHCRNFFCTAKKSA